MSRDAHLTTMRSFKIFIIRKLWCPFLTQASCFRMFSLMCAGCQQPIQPKKGQTKAPRIRALDQVWWERAKERDPSIWLNYCRITTSTASSVLTVAWCSARAPRGESPGQEQEAESFATSKFIRGFKKFLWDCQMRIALGVKTWHYSAGRDQ